MADRYGPSTAIQDMLEVQAGYRPASLVGAVRMQFGHCATPAGHPRCPAIVAVGPTTYLCSCPCGHGRPAPRPTPPADRDQTGWEVK